jgi:peptide/nickel transport system substrate-binding protein
MDFEPLVVTNATCGEGDFIKEIAAVDEHTVRFTLCRPDPAFIAKAAFEPFAIQPREYIEAQGGSGLLLEAPIGTGPYRLESWDRGSSLNFTRFDDYWGTPALAETGVIRWSTESAARLLELQSGTVHIISNLAADDFAVVENDPNLQLIPQANPNTLYLGWTNTFEPFDNPQVRQAIALGIDRQRLVDNFMPEGTEVADFFTPCTVPNGCDGDPWYDFDPEAARDLLAEAGYPDGFSTIIAYRDVFRGYLPSPGDVAVEIQTQLLENLNITAEVVQMESGEFIDVSTSGRLDGMYLLGWGADYLHVTNFLDYHFGRNTVQFGNPFPEIYEPLEEAASLEDPVSCMLRPTTPSASWYRWSRFRTLPWVMPLWLTWKAPMFLRSVPLNWPSCCPLVAARWCTCRTLNRSACTAWTNQTANRSLAAARCSKAS